jgi:hypothetical protein
MNMKNQVIEHILTEIEDYLWETEARVEGPPDFSNNALRAAIKIFMSVAMDHLYRKMKAENLDLDSAAQQAALMGSTIRQYIKDFLDVDTFELYKTNAKVIDMMEYKKSKEQN